MPPQQINTDDFNSHSTHNISLGQLIFACVLTGLFVFVPSWVMHVNQAHDYQQQLKAANETITALETTINQKIASLEFKNQDQDQKFSEKIQGFLDTVKGVDTQTIKQYLADSQKDNEEGGKTLSSIIGKDEEATRLITHVKEMIHQVEETTLMQLVIETKEAIKTANGNNIDMIAREKRWLADLDSAKTSAASANATSNKAFRIANQANSTANTAHTKAEQAIDDVNDLEDDVDRNEDDIDDLQREVSDLKGK